MHSDPAFSIITSYHFRKTAEDSYQRLLRSLRRSLLQVGKRGRVILVANGTDDNAEAPDVVTNDLGMVDGLEIVELAKNTGGPAGSLNAGIQMALEFPLNVATEWLVSVQSSVVLEQNWCLSVLSAGAQNPSADSVYGRLTYEDDPNLIWADGHYLSAGRTFNENFQKPSASAGQPSPAAFPCLSAAAFKRGVVQQIFGKYGNFVCEHVNHYGDCTDVAVRLADLKSQVKHVFCSNAVGVKRRPVEVGSQIACSQILAAGWYYTNKTAAAESRVAAKGKRYCIDAIRQARSILGARYSPTGRSAPQVLSSLDTDWGRP